MKVLEQLTKIKQELARVGIAKGGKNEMQNFVFRSIDQMYNTIGPLFAEHGVHTIPEVLERVENQYQTAKGGRMFHVVLQVKYYIYSDDGDYISVVVSGEALDTSDKATNKAFTQAYKYMLIQTLCIPLEATDPDEESPRIASFTDEEKQIYDELLISRDAIEFYIYIRSLPKLKSNSLYNSFPKGDITKKKKEVDELFKLGWDIYVSTYLDPMKKYIQSEDTVALIQLKSEINAQLGQFINADLDHEDKAKAKELIESLTDV